MPSTGSLFLDGLLLRFLRLLSTPIYDLYVVVENSSDNWDHICLYHPSPYRLRATDPDIDNTLERKIPFPHIHHVLASACLEKADQPFDTAIDGKNISDACGGCREVGEVVQGIDEW
jgi:hypothetical protein